MSNPAAFTKLSKQTHTHPKVVYQSNDLTILKSMVRENVGIGFLAEIAVHPEDHLVCLPLSDEVLDFIGKTNTADRHASSRTSSPSYP